MKRTLLLPLVLVLLGTAPAAAKDWAAALFSKTAHDFGVVARGAHAEYRFTIDNIYVEDVHIVSVESSCGCTVPKLTKDTLKTYETAEVIAQLDTRRFKGPKEATITVTLDRPFYARVQLKVCCYIRSDVVFQPGAAQFGSVRQGTSVPQRITVNYAGRQDWQITGVLGAPAFLETRISEVSRTPQSDGTCLVNYDLWLVLRETAPPGLFQENLLVQTNDLNRLAASVPLTVNGWVVPALSVSPSPLLLGVVRPNQSAAKNLVVKGEKPFRITELTGPDSRFRFQASAESRAVHIVPMVFTATAATGRVTGKIRLTTDLPGVAPAEVVVDGQVMAEAAVPAAPDPTAVPPTPTAVPPKPAVAPSASGEPASRSSDGWMPSAPAKGLPATIRVSGGGT